MHSRCNSVWELKRENQKFHTVVCTCWMHVSVYLLRLIGVAVCICIGCVLFETHTHKHSHTDTQVLFIIVAGRYLLILSYVSFYIHARSYDAMHQTPNNMLCVQIGFGLSAAHRVTCSSTSSLLGPQHQSAMIRRSYLLYGWRGCWMNFSDI